MCHVVDAFLIPDLHHGVASLVPRMFTGSVCRSKSESSEMKFSWDSPQLRRVGLLEIRALRSSMCPKAEVSLQVYSTLPAQGSKGGSRVLGKHSTEAPLLGHAAL